jgi:hypothetical protein
MLELVVKKAYGIDPAHVTIIESANGIKRFLNFSVRNLDPYSE